MLQAQVQCVVAHWSHTHGSFTTTAVLSHGVHVHESLAVK